ncbi:hypothetical protein Daus18300_013167 [Diaporthe australafricana]|uniref:Transmembrane protein n=1 Tax=Diaporthe australafricana TaxID=127596 RepID=A0ABR3W008_9PEZI
MTTPGNITFSTAYAETMWSTVLVIKAATPYNTENYTDFTSQPVPTNFMRFVVFRQPNSNYVTEDDTVEETLECDLSFAAYKYSNATSVGNNFAFGHVEPIVLEPGSFVHIGNNNEQSYVVFNTSGLPEFRVSMWDLGALLQFFPSDSFSGTLAIGEVMAEFFSAPAGITPAVWKPKSNISQILQDMATSMTDQLRSSYNETAPGLTAKSVVVVRVHWPWLALPFAVVLSAAVLLLAEMIESRRSKDISLWKSSSTALLFHSVLKSQGIITGSSDAETPRQLEKLTKATRVRLERKGEAHTSYSIPLAPMGTATHNQPT